MKKKGSKAAAVEYGTAEQALGALIPGYRPEECVGEKAQLEARMQGAVNAAMQDLLAAFRAGLDSVKVGSGTRHGASRR